MHDEFALEEMRLRAELEKMDARSAHGRQYAKNPARGTQSLCWLIEAAEHQSGLATAPTKLYAT